ncbi:MAG: cytochrome P450 [Kribbellaceae bacterium]|nr:cytochrome P450 [Kribbellaceae bacterium]
MNAAEILQELVSPAGRADPFPLYAAAHRLGPLLAVTDDIFLAVGYAAVNEALRNPAFEIPTESSTQPSLELMQRSILRANPPNHGRMRSLISQVFTPRRVAELRPAVEAAVDDLLDGLPGGLPAEVDFMDRFAFQLPVTVICELLGVPTADRSRFRPLASDLTAALELTDTADDLADAAARELGTYFSYLIQDPPPGGLIAALVAARERLSDEELLANLILLLVAGFETTTDLLGNGLAIRLRHPDLPTDVAFVEEVLRYDSPVQVTTRVAARPSEIAGTPIPAGSNVVLLLGAANRDPARFPDPDRFDPGRPGNKPLSFGAGAHICLGNSLARLEATIAFDRLRQFTITPNGEPTRRDRLVLRGYQTLPVKLSGAR